MLIFNPLPLPNTGPRQASGRRGHRKAWMKRPRCWIVSDVSRSSRIATFAVMWEKQCHKPPMTGNSLYMFIPPIKRVMTGGLFIHVLPTFPRMAHDVQSILEGPGTQETARLGVLIAQSSTCGNMRGRWYLTDVKTCGVFISPAI